MGQAYKSSNFRVSRFCGGVRWILEFDAIFICMFFILFLHRMTEGSTSVGF